MSSSPNTSDSRLQSQTPTATTRKTKFKRNYLACLNCRTRKVKCDLGSVDNPHDPPCARCKRERKECVFVESKRGGSKNVLSGKKRKMNHSDDNSRKRGDSASPASDSVNDYNRAKQLPLPSLNQISSFGSYNLPGSVPSSSGLPSLGSFATSNNNILGNQQYQPTVPPLTTGLHLPPQAGSFAVSQLPSLSLTQPTSTTSNLRSTVPEVPVPVPVVRPQQASDVEPPLKSESQPLALSKSHSTSFGKGLLEGPNQSIASNSTIVFLAHLGGRPAQADDRDRIDARERIEKLESRLSSKRSYSKSNHSSVVDGASESPSIVSPSNTYVAPSSVASLQNDGLTPDEYLNERFGHDNPLFPTIRNNRLAMPRIESTLNIRPKPTSKLSDIDYIGEKSVITEEEARRLIKLYTITMHPFFPYVPEELLDPDVLPGYPMLLCAILSISSRYHTMEMVNGTPHATPTNRHIEIHEQLWIYCQRLISMTVWGEQSSRTIGTLLSFLLFTEWNPRAIHFRWSDYANSPEDDQNNSDESYAGLSALKRSESMSFMLIGVATRLSFLLDDHPLVFMATHISETNSAIEMNKRSMLSQTLGEVDVNDSNSRFSFTSNQKATIELLQFASLCYETLYGRNPRLGTLDRYQNLTVLDILSPILENWYKKYYKLLKPSTSHSTGQKEDIDWLSLQPKAIKDLTVQIGRESLILDYYYTKLFLYSLALSGDTSVNSSNNTSKKGRNLRLDEMVKYSRYVELAYSAAKEVLFVIQRVSKLKMLKFMPVRWVSRTIRAVAFVVKCYLTLTNDDHDTNKSNIDSNDGNGTSKSSSSGESTSQSNGNNNTINNKNTTTEIIKLSVIPIEEIITLLQKTSISLRDAAPDELHLCTRYSTILMYLCSQFKTKLKTRNGRKVVDYEKEIKQRDERLELEKKQFEQAQQEKQQQQAQQLEQDQQNLQNQQQQHASQHQQNQTINNQQHYPLHNISQQNQSHFSAASSSSSLLHQTATDAQFFDNYFLNADPSDTIFNWFTSNNNPGLDFVDDFTKEIELDFMNKHSGNGNGNAASNGNANGNGNDVNGGGVVNGSHVNGGTGNVVNNERT
ncbi:unnamed protein product [Ambrosiozyma monospora]|uniref:Unnamed protein product n=1 Tax=Ambrosiozyma monospora TaxID=43982 RepID=A0A9W7DEX0_AMBMO|nr:unnamed protein product [Ambrosiozyma monospora]